MGVVKGNVRLAKNDDFKAFESILQIGRLGGGSCLLYTSDAADE